MKNGFGNVISYYFSIFLSSSSMQHKIYMQTKLNILADFRLSHVIIFFPISMIITPANFVLQFCLIPFSFKTEKFMLNLWFIVYKYIYDQLSHVRCARQFLQEFMLLCFFYGLQNCMTSFCTHWMKYLLIYFSSTHHFLNITILTGFKWYNFTAYVIICSNPWKNETKQNKKQSELSHHLYFFFIFIITTL